MSPRLRRLLTVSASIFIGATGGVVLGNFALTGLGQRTGPSGADELRVLAGNAASTSPKNTADLSPEGYVCQGCDASPGNDAAPADAWHPFDSAPLPPYRPDEPTAQPVRLPVLAADKTPMRVDVPPAVKAVPVLAADRATGEALPPPLAAAPPPPAAASPPP